MSVSKANLFIAGPLLALGIALPAVAQDCPRGPTYGGHYDVYIRIDRAGGEDEAVWRRRRGEMSAWWSGIQEGGRIYFPGFLSCASMNPGDTRHDETGSGGFVAAQRTVEMWVYCKDANGKPVQQDPSWPAGVKACGAPPPRRPVSAPASPRPSVPASPTRAAPATPAPVAPVAPKPVVTEADAQAAARLAEQRNAELAAQRAATDRLNAEVARADAETVARNRAKEEQFAREQEEHRRQLAAVEAETARIRAENEAVQRAFAERRAAWEAQVAACNRGDRAACTGQTPAKPAGPRQAYWFVYAVGAEHVGYESAKMMTAAEAQAEEAMLTRLAPQRYGASVRVLRVPVPRSDMCSQLYVEGPADKTYNLKSGPRDYVERGVDEMVRLWSGRAVSGVVCN